MQPCITTGGIINSPFTKFFTEGSERANPWWYASPTVENFPLYSNGAGNSMTIKNGINGLLINGVGGVANDGIACFTAPMNVLSVNNWRLEAHINASLTSVLNNGLGIVALETSSGKWVRLGIAAGGPANPFQIDQSYGTLNAWGGGIGTGFPNIPLLNLHCALSYNHSTDMIVTEISADAETWAQTGSIARATVFTDLSDQIGVYVAPNADNVTIISGSCDRFVFQSN